METPSVGTTLTLTFDSAAHGGESVARTDGMVVFVPRTVPGDVAVVELTEVKKRFARGRVVELLAEGPGRVPDSCPAAQQGAGCCDYSFVASATELSLKHQVLRDQLERIGRLTAIPPIDIVDLAPATGWRTRFRLGVNAQGQAGFRAAHSNEVITGQQCRQAAPGVLDGIVGPDARVFEPDSEIIVAIDSDENRHVVQTSKAGRGKTARKVVQVLEGDGMPVQRVGNTTWQLPAVSFWQAHSAAPAAYSKLVTEWIKEAFQDEATYVRAALDLYGGVGMFVPAIQAALPKATVHSVELAPQAAKVGKTALHNTKVQFHTQDVYASLPHLPKAGVVVLDPPRKGAGEQTIERLAAAAPEVVIHVGCDPATFARDLGAWQQHGYELVKLTMFNAFPGTHHSETFGLLIPAPNEDLG
ncbi:TRAM domain-containing protein [Staphylococcus chromogenes]|nr:TRAM domain-containing protein [Staphylococcus chromogenes]